MSKEIDFDVYVHIVGTVKAKSESEEDLLDAIFPGGWEGEVLGVSTDIRFLPNGYINASETSEDDDCGGDDDEA